MHPLWDKMGKSVTKSCLDHSTFKRITILVSQLSWKLSQIEKQFGDYIQWIIRSPFNL